ncbi:MAG: hypothetical protein CM1200mP5_0620 [Candidatus Pelagibacterales bacterium]|nr:MAG: hypothetical protein CM1200mP5_0620 [Pelagibacterales bacterium]
MTKMQIFQIKKKIGELEYEQFLNTGERIIIGKNQKMNGKLFL